MNTCLSSSHLNDHLPLCFLLGETNEENILISLHLISWHYSCSDDHEKNNMERDSFNHCGTFFFFMSALWFRRQTFILFTYQKHSPYRRLISLQFSVFPPITEVYNCKSLRKSLWRCFISVIARLVSGG